MVLILMVNGIQVDASKTKNNRQRSGSGSGSRVSSSSSQHGKYSPSSLSYSPGDIPRQHVPQQQAHPPSAPVAHPAPYPVVQQQSRPVQSAPPVASAPVAAPPPLPMQHPANAPAQSQPGNIGWNVGEQRQSVNSVNSAPPPYPSGIIPNNPHAAPPPYAGNLAKCAYY